MAASELAQLRLDPENLFRFSVSCNFDPLKNAVIYMLEQIRDNTANIHYLREKAGIPAAQVIPPAVLPSSLILELKVLPGTT